MSVTISDVVTAYRAFLGREPEDFKAIAFHQKASDLVALRRAMVSSSEFQTLNNIFLIGQHTDIDTFHVEVDATTQQITQMFSNIATTWRALGSSEPYWSVLTSNIFLSTTIRNTIEYFYRTGDILVDNIIALLKRNSIDFSRQLSCLDFGCGVGRLTIPLSKYFYTVTGIDVSQNHLIHARNRQQKEGILNINFQIIQRVEDIEDIEQYDMFLTLIVLQHNPPPVIKFMLSRLMSHLKTDGVGIFQVPTFKENYTFSIERYLQCTPSTDMEMHALPQKEIYKIIHDENCELLEVREDTMAQAQDTVSQTFLVKKK